MSALPLEGESGSITPHLKRASSAAHSKGRKKQKTLGMGSSKAKKTHSVSNPDFIEIVEGDVTVPHAEPQSARPSYRYYQTDE